MNAGQISQTARTTAAAHLNGLYVEATVEIENGKSMTASQGSILGLYGECIETTVFVNRFGNIAASISWAGQSHDFVKPQAATRFLAKALMGGSPQTVQAVSTARRVTRRQSRKAQLNARAAAVIPAAALAAL